MCVILFLIDSVYNEESSNDNTQPPLSQSQPNHLNGSQFLCLPFLASTGFLLAPSLYD